MILDIGDADAVFGPRCDKPTMPISLSIFDNGSAEGLMEAQDWEFAQSWLCVCAQRGCPDDVAMKIMERARKTFIDDKGKREREGVFRWTNSLTSHSCLSAPVGATLYKLGFQCGVRAGLTSKEVRDERHETFLKVSQGNEVRAAELESACAAYKASAAPAP